MRPPPGATVADAHSLMAIAARWPRHRGRARACSRICVNRSLRESHALRRGLPQCSDHQRAGEKGHTRGDCHIAPGKPQSAPISLRNSGVARHDRASVLRDQDIGRECPRMPGHHWPRDRTSHCASGHDDHIRETRSPPARGSVGSRCCRATPTGAEPIHGRKVVAAASLNRANRNKYDAR